MRSRRRARTIALTAAIGATIALAIPTTSYADPTADSFTVDDATVNTTLTSLFETYGDTSGRWSGADSAYSVELPDGSIAWIYSDTFMGTVNPDHSRPLDSPFIHNSVIIDDADSLTTYTGGTTDTPESLVTVPGGDESSDWYWFGDGTVEGSTLQIMLIEFIKTGPDPFDFAFAGSAIASFDLTDMSLTGITELSGDLVEWGSAIMEDGGDTYVYGIEDLGADKYAHVAKVPAGQLTDQSAWLYWDGTAWNADEAASTRIVTGISNEFSVSMYQGRYTLVAQDTTEPLSAKIVAMRADSPVGPFDPAVQLYITPETSGNVFTYNAKAHPELGDNDTLLVTYNVNSFDTDDVYTDVDNYRPRYIDVTTSANPQLTAQFTGSTTLTAGVDHPISLQISNRAGLRTADGVTVTKTIPNGFDITATSPGGVWDSATRTVTWSAATLPASTTTDFAVTVRPSTVIAGTQATFQARIVGSNTCTSGCTANVTVTVQAAPATTPATPAASSTPAQAMPATGTNGTAALVAGALLIAGTATIATRRRAAKQS